MPLNQVPQAGQNLAQTQNGILNNFATINTAFSVDHASFTAANQGFHNKLSMPVQAVIPPQIAAGMLVYCQTSALTNQPELVVAKQIGSTAPISAIINEFTGATYNAQGWTRLPSGILVKWGSGQHAFTLIPDTRQTTVAFPMAASIPPFTAIYQVILTNGYDGLNVDPNTIVYAGTFTTADFSMYATNRAAGIGGIAYYNYVAIGV